MLKRYMAFGLAVLLFVWVFAACADAEESAPEPSSSESISASSEPPPPPEPAGPLVEELPLATPEVNCLTGLALAAPVEAGQRPVAVMVSNNERGLPQRGLAAADVVYEMLTEGGITRLMAVYADYRAMPQVGPVRSTRDQFVQFAVPQDMMLSHIGGSVYANNLLRVLAYPTVDGIRLGSSSFWFDTARSLPKPGGKLNEYCYFTDAALFAAGMQTAGVQPLGEVHDLFLFADEAAEPSTEAELINCRYSAASWSGFAYDAATGLYVKRIFDVVPHADEDGTPLQYTNVVMLECPITLKPDGLLTDFDLAGGEGYYFTAGGVTPVTWVKGGPNDALHLFGPDGKELHVQRGKTFVGLLPDDVEDALTYGPRTPPVDPAAASSATAPASDG